MRSEVEMHITSATVSRYDSILKARVVCNRQRFAQYAWSVDADGCLEWFVTLSIEVTDKYDGLSVSDGMEHLATLIA